MGEVALPLYMQYGFILASCVRRRGAARVSARRQRSGGCGDACCGRALIADVTAALTISSYSVPELQSLYVNTHGILQAEVAAGCSRAGSAHAQRACV